MSTRPRLATLLFAAMLTIAASATIHAAGAEAETSAASSKCKNACNKKCDGASNKSKCVATCRRACDGK